MFIFKSPASQIEVGETPSHIAKPVIAKVEVEKKQQIKPKPQQKIYYNIPLSHELQDYIKQISKQYDVEEFIIYSIIKKESNFNPNAININSNGTKDFGICQLNNRYMYKFAKQAGVKNFNPFDPKQNIQVGTFILHTYKQYWQKRGLTGEELKIHMVNSFNLGVYGFKKYVSRSGQLHRKYSKDVLGYRNQLKEKGEISE